MISKSMEASSGHPLLPEENKALENSAPSGAAL